MQRSRIDLHRAQHGLGMGASRVDERIMSVMGLLPTGAPVRFESCESLPFGGVMLLYPFLVECGLLSCRKHYVQRQGGYYNFDTLFITIAMLYLCRIKSFEQIKHHSPGEFGKLIGYDRIPEVKTIRKMICEITHQGKVDNWSADLCNSWIEDEEPQLFYVDGHVQVYHGYLANLGKKHVSRQRLCLPGMMEFWINASDGSPYFFITASVNEKMIEMLRDEIVPKLLELHTVSEEHRQKMQANSHEPLFTLVFDREAYSPVFFKKLWDDHKIAILTYRKHVKDKWDESVFVAHSVETTFGDVEMKLHEQNLTIDGCQMRQVRKLCDDGHQTSIITTNKILTIQKIASNMFARWAQENFFRYMRQEYAMDKIIQYATDDIDGDVMVVNQAYNNITNSIKSERDKLSRRKAKLFQYQQEDPLQEIDEKEQKKLMKKKLDVLDEIETLKNKIDSLVVQRKDIPYKIAISQMPESTRYDRLHYESKALQNLIKMICYRAETAIARLLTPHYKRANQEIRALVKSVINTRIDMEVDDENQLLKITLYPLANQRSNDAVDKICDTLNQTKTIYKGTNLTLFYKIAT